MIQMRKIKLRTRRMFNKTHSTLPIHIHGWTTRLLSYSILNSECPFWQSSRHIITSTCPANSINVQIPRLLSYPCVIWLLSSHPWLFSSGDLEQVRHPQQFARQVRPPYKTKYVWERLVEEVGEFRYAIIQICGEQEYEQGGHEHSRRCFVVRRCEEWKCPIMFCDQWVTSY